MVAGGVLRSEETGRGRSSVVSLRPWLLGGLLRDPLRHHGLGLLKRLWTYHLLGASSLLGNHHLLCLLLEHLNLFRWHALDDLRDLLLLLGRHVGWIL